MSEGIGRTTFLYYDVDRIVVDAERCLECQQENVCMSQCTLGLEIPKAMAAIAHRAFVVREGVREELEEAAAAAHAREALNNSFAHW